MSQTPDRDPVIDPVIDGPVDGGRSVGPSVGEPLDGSTPIPAQPTTQPTTGPTTPSTDQPAPGRRSKKDDPLRSSRASGFYTAVIALGVVLVLLIIFIVQNTGKADVHFLGFGGRAPQAVLLLIALAAGIFLTATASTLRLIQVRHRVKKERKARA